MGGVPPPSFSMMETCYSTVRPIDKHVEQSRIRSCNVQFVNGESHIWSIQEKPKLRPNSRNHENKTKKKPRNSHACRIHRPPPLFRSFSHHTAPIRLLTTPSSHSLTPLPLPQFLLLPLPLLSLHPLHLALTHLGLLNLARDERALVGLGNRLVERRMLAVALVVVRALLGLDLGRDLGQDGGPDAVDAGLRAAVAVPDRDQVAVEAD